jgi:hypothetical protein
MDKPLHLTDVNSNRFCAPLRRSLLIPFRLPRGCGGSLARSDSRRWHGHSHHPRDPGNAIFVRRNSPLAPGSTGADWTACRLQPNRTALALRCLRLQRSAPGYASRACAAAAGSKSFCQRSSCRRRYVQVIRCASYEVRSAISCRSTRACPGVIGSPSCSGSLG